MTRTPLAEVHTGARQYDARMSESLARAFPARLAPVLASVVQALPAARLGPSGSVTASSSRTLPGLVVAGEPVVIPYRIYNPAPPPHLASRLSAAELAVTAAIYSRHHDGRIRQRALGTLLDCDEPWTAPFIVQLLGEYVIQICADIETFTRTALPARPAMQASLPAFLTQNPRFAELARQRAISYWSCYYRALHPSRDTYPALTALSRLGASTTA
jgi:hypothetical protein